MRLTTIWTLRGMKLRDRFKESGDTMASWIAYRLPKRIKFWAYIHVGVAAMNDQDIVPNVKFIDLLERAEGAPK